MKTEETRGKKHQKPPSTSDAVDPRNTEHAEAITDDDEKFAFTEKSVRELCRSQLSNEQIAAACDRSVEEVEQTYGEQLTRWRTAGIGFGKFQLFKGVRKGSMTAIALFTKSNGGTRSIEEEAAENSIAKYKAQLRDMSESELHDEIERQEIACGSHTQEKAATGEDRRDSPPN